MTEIEDVRSLFERWEKVWHDGALDMIPHCVAPAYIRHDEMGDRTVSREEYAAEMAALQTERPDVRIIVYDHLLEPKRAWFRLTMRWTDQVCRAVQTRAAIQSYRIEDGKLAETWVAWQPVGSAWNDAMAQPNWTTRVTP